MKARPPIGEVVGAWNVVQRFSVPPNSGAVSVLSLSGGDIRGRMTELRESLRAQSIIVLFGGWFWGDQMDDVVEVLRN